MLPVISISFNEVLIFSSILIIVDFETNCFYKTKIESQIQDCKIAI